ncbi:hypothetical protein E2C01_083610 [Portunus trituberculatus]|uniref:Uncharacterized protein n=1 Tax=Portunus trituberculatus TaxID=210409 RepID=A0A5B7ISX4_PORTR|nr:hypothetical protein [Portunus trituberculatus]
MRVPSFFHCAKIYGSATRRLHGYSVPSLCHHWYKYVHIFTARALSPCPPCTFLHSPLSPSESRTKILAPSTCRPFPLSVATVCPAPSPSRRLSPTCSIRLVCLARTDTATAHFSRLAVPCQGGRENWWRHAHTLTPSTAVFPTLPLSISAPLTTTTTITTNATTTTKSV